MVEFSETIVKILSNGLGIKKKKNVVTILRKFELVGTLNSE